VDIYLWQPNEPEPFATLSGHQGGVVDMAFDPSGELLVSASWDGTLRLWDLTTGESVTDPSGGQLLRLSRDGRRLISYWGSQYTLKSYEIVGERVCRFLRAPELESVNRGKLAGVSFSADFSPDGNLLVTCHPDGIRLWEAASAKLLAHIPESEIYSAFFGPRGEQLIASGQNGVLRWPVAQLLKPGGPAGCVPEQLDASSDCNRACISPDRIEVAYACGTQVRLLNSRLRLECPPPANWVALSPDRQWVAGSPWALFGVRLWNARTGEIVRDFPFSTCTFVCFTPDSRWLVTGDGDEF
jgi:WD40 repeat protein